MTYPQHRPFLDRAADEVRSWLGNERAEERRAIDERWARVRNPHRVGRDDYRYAGETILGRADWGDHESDYEHGFRPPGWLPTPEGGIAPVLGYAGRGPRGYRRSDDRICEDVCDRLTEDPSVDASDVEVHVADGEVTLAGSVESRWEKRRAEDDAMSTSGVRDVVNRLRVVPAPSPIGPA